MTKSLTPAELAEQLQALGMPIPDELVERVANSVSDTAEESILEHLADSTKEYVERAAEWRESLFATAAEMADEFKGQEKNVGQGRVFERSIEIETPHGKFMIRLREPREKK